MIRYNGLAQIPDGPFSNGASVRVVDFNTGLNAPLFDDIGAPITNPVIAGVGGLYSFFIDAGRYSLTITAGPYVLAEDDVTIQEDPFLAYLVNDDSVAFAYGDPVYISGDGLVRKAGSAGTDAQAAVYATCMEDTLDSADTGRFRLFGEITRAGTPGVLSYLGQAGEITETIPEYDNGDRYSVILGRQLAALSFLFNPPNSGGVVPIAPRLPIPFQIGDPSMVGLDGPITDKWLDRENYLYYIITGATHVTDASGTYVRSYAACLNLLTMLWTAWAPVLTSANAHIWSDPGTSWIYLSQGGTVNGGPSGQTRRVNKTTGTTNDAGFTPSDTAATGFIENASGDIWGGVGHDYFGIIGVCEHYDTSGTTSPPGYVYTPGGGGYLPEAVPYAYVGSGLGIASAPSSFYTHTGPVTFLAAGVALFDTVSGLVVAASYGVNANHARVATDVVLGKVVVTGPFTDVVNAALSSVQTVQGMAILSASLSAFYPFAVTFTALGTERDGAIDPDTGAFFGGGNIKDIDGHTTRHAIFKMDLAGTLNLAFNPLVTSGFPDVLAVVVIGGVVIVGGSWAGPLWNGEAKDFLVFLRADDGTLYTGTP